VPVIMVISPPEAGIPLPSDSSSSHLGLSARSPRRVSGRYASLD
jgi:hypothetical protein